MKKNEKQFLQYAEIYTSLQGEGSHSGIPCFFIRTAVCDIRCHWCDTPHALGRGKWISLSKLLEKIPKHVSLVQITGGEPLVQKDAIITLITKLQSPPLSKKVLLETGGHRSLKKLPKKTHIVMDIKLPGSGEGHHDFAANFSYLKKSDEIKFVIANKEDFDKALEWIAWYKLTEKCHLLFSGVWGVLPLTELSKWFIKAGEKGKIKMQKGLETRLQVQLHKIIWPNQTKAV